MKKLIYVLGLVAMLWLIKLSFDFYQVSARLDGLQDALHQSEQQNAHLNDRLVAVQRQVEAQSEQPASQVSAQNSDAISSLTPNLLIQQQLELVQFALQQHQYVYAIEKLNQLQQALQHYALADTLKTSLYQAIEQDKQNIQKFVLAMNTQKAQLDDILQQLDQKISQELKNTQLTPATHSNAHFWQKWFQVDVLSSSSPELVNRKAILKEAQLRILLAQHALAQGETVEYQSLLTLAIQQLNTLPDAASQKLKQQLLNVKQQPMLPVPKLSSTAILR